MSSILGPSRASAHASTRHSWRGRAGAWWFAAAIGWLLIAGPVPRADAQTLQTIAGGRTNLFQPDFGFTDGDLTDIAQFHSPGGCATDAAGNLVLADTDNNAIRKLDFGRNISATIIANLNTPVGVAFDSTNNLYVLVQGSGTILRYDWFDTFYRLPVTLVSTLLSPTAFVLDANTNLYVAELGGMIKRVRLADGAVTEVRRGLNQPRGLALLDNGWLAVSDTGNQVLRFLDPVTGAEKKQVGTGVAGFRDGEATAAQFSQPWQIAKAPNGMLVVADRLNHRVRLVTATGKAMTLYGVDPSLWFGPCLTCNPIELPGWYDGVDGNVGSAEAREPVGVTVDKDGTVYVTEDFYHIVRRVTGAGLGGTGGGGGGGNTNIVVLPPLVSPLAGYYPTGVDIRVVSPNTDPILVSRVFYTTDGSEPGPDNVNSRSVTLTDNAGTIRWQEGTRDLTSLRVRAFLGNVGSATVSGLPVSANQIGVASDITAGQGATVLIPVVASLKPGETLKSLQFLVEVAPVGAAPRLTSPMRILPLAPNDFVTVVAASTNAPIARGETNTGTFKLEVAFFGTNTAFNVQAFAVVTLLSVTIPGTASLNDRYTISVLEPSGTSDGLFQDVALGPLPVRVITVQNQAYLVGDVAPGGWYNAGDFGDGDLRNNDVNSAFYASLGVRVPPFFTDVFDAMDAFPEDADGAVGGDGRIRFLDWQILLDRSLRVRTNNWQRSWSAGARVPSRSELRGSALRLAQSTDASPAGSKVQITRLEAAAALRVGSVSYAQPGARVALPVSVRLAPGATLAGLQFRAVVQPESGAPPLELPVEFVQAVDLPPPITVAGLARNQVGLAWSLLLNPVSISSPGETQVGTISFTVPAAAQPGGRYTVAVDNADGAPDLRTQYDFEVQPGQAAVLALAIARTNPTYQVRWPGVLGKRYLLESTANLAAERWTIEAAELVGRGQVLDFIDRNVSQQRKFYRVRVIE